MSLKKNNRKASRKVSSSIAIKLNSIFVSRLFIKFIIMDVLLLIVVLSLWCINSEIDFFGEFVPRIERSFNFYPIENAVYTATGNNGVTLVKDASEFLELVKKVAFIALIAQGIMLLDEINFGTSNIRKSLKPLNDMAETASRLSNIAFDESKVHNLEEAISKISPVLYSDEIHTGDTELQGLEKAINDLLERMRESYRQQARFVSDASHELRTPISVIQGYANMLDRWGKEDEKVLNESISAIKSEAENMKNLVEQLLFLARGANGKTTLNIKKFILNDLIMEVFEESKMIDERHKYEYKEYGMVEVEGDEALLKQTARILVENAMKYSDNEENIILKVGSNEKGQPYFAVQDTGIGMDSEDMCHVFERFFRADSARSRKTGGTGLGLSIAKWIVDSHKGYFEVLSRKEIGTRITVFLPYKNKKE